MEKSLVQRNNWKMNPCETKLNNRGLWNAESRVKAKNVKFVWLLLMYVAVLLLKLFF